MAESSPILDLMALVTDESVRYLPKLNAATGSKEATILLLRILHWWQWAKSQGRTSFWKFAAPCAHPDYKQGDSWQEELGFTRAEFETALAKIGTRLKAGEDKAAILQNDGANAAVLYYTNAKRVTFYHVNERVVFLLFSRSYSEIQHQTNAEILHQLSSAENQHQASAENQHQLSIHRDNSSHRSTTPTQSATRAPAPNAKKKSSRIDPRRKHPAVQLVYQMIGHLPKKLYWDDIIAVADPEQTGMSKLDFQKLKALLRLAVEVGVYEGNLGVWFLSWYVDGVPTHYRNRPLEGETANKYRRQRNGAQQTGRTNDAVQGSGQDTRRSVLRKGLNETA